MARRHDEDDVEDWWDGENQPRPEELEADPEAPEVGPSYRYVVRPMARVPPYTRQLRRALLRHRLLFHYYVRPVFCTKGRGIWLCQNALWRQGDSYDPPREVDAEEVWRWERAVEDDLRRIGETSTPQTMVSYDAGEPAPPLPFDQGQTISIAWDLHPVGSEVLNPSSADIESLVGLLMGLDPDRDERAILDNTMFYARPRPMPLIGPVLDAGGDTPSNPVAWDYPGKLRLMDEQLERIARLERNAGSAWRPAIDPVGGQNSQSQGSTTAAQHDDAEKRWFPAKWYSERTQQALYPGLLRRAWLDQRIDRRKVSGRNQYEFASVCRAYPAYVAQLAHDK